MTQYFLFITLTLLPFNSNIYAMKEGRPAKSSKAERILSTSLEEIARQTEVKAEKQQAKREAGEATISRQTLLNRIADVKVAKEGAKEALEKLIDLHPDLLKEYDKFGNSLLYEILLLDDQEIFLFATKKLGTIDTNKIFKKRNDREELLLHSAAMFGKDAIVQNLLEIYPDAINETGKSGMTPFHYAAENGRTKTVELLIASKNLQDPCALNGTKEPAILLAAAHGHFDIVALLLEKSLKCLQAQDAIGNTVAHYAVMGFGTEDILQKLHDLAPQLKLFTITNNQKLTPVALAQQLLIQAKDSEEKSFRTKRVELLEKLK